MLHKAFSGENKMLVGAMMIALIFVLPALCAADPDGEAAEQLLRRGQMVKARDLLGKALKRAPSDHHLRFLYARTLPIDQSIKLLDSLSRSQSVPARLRADSYRLQGDHAFIQEHYKKAATFYRQAFQHDSLSSSRHLQALSSALDNDFDVAEKLWQAISSQSTDKFCAAANLHLAYLSMGRQDWEKGYALLAKAALPDTASPWYVPYIWAMNECAKELKDEGNVSVHQKQLGNFKGALLESIGKLGIATGGRSLSNADPKKIITQKSDSTKLAESISKTAESGGPKGNAGAKTPLIEATAGFTVQVGAFGSRENAERLKTQLEASYKDVTLQTASGGEQVLYRVRIGAFSSREAALVFAEDTLAGSGLSTRVVEK